VSLDHQLVEPASTESTEFRVWVDLEAEPVRVGVAGEIDLLTCAPFRHALEDACASRPRRLALDFRSVAFLGSTGLREIARILLRLESIEIRSPSPHVRHVLEMMELDGRVVITD
jgi:anti-anti-sigma factor